MPFSNILVVVVDGLRAAALGAYGNTNFPTPALDRFTADSMLFDACFAPADELPELYRALWYSQHPVRRVDPSGPAPQPGGLHSLPRVFGELGYRTTLITDEPQLTKMANASEFHECIEMLGGGTPSGRAADFDSTNLARLFAGLDDAVFSAATAAATPVDRPMQPPQLLWLHAQGMYGPWDAPLDLQRSLLAEDDAPPIEDVATPHVTFGPEHDPDLAFRYGTAYAAQVIVLDHCWRRLADTLAAAGGQQPWLVMLLGARGFPLGEHGRVGGIDARLPAEQLHVPWVAFFPDGRGRLARSPALVSHFDVMPTLVEWVSGRTAPPLCRDGSSVLPLAASQSQDWRDSLLSTSSTGAYAIRTSAWCLRGDRDGAAKMLSGADLSQSAYSPSGELYVRPDDRWEANDVAKLCRDVVDELSQLAAVTTNRLADATPANST